MLLYLHGFLSSPASDKAVLTGAALAAAGLAAHFACPALPVDPTAALALAEQHLRQAHAVGEPVLLIGSSLGGHYATVLAERHGCPAVLINPAVVSNLELTRFVGRHQHFHSGATVDFTAAMAAALRAQVPTHITAQQYWLLAARNDETLDYRQAVNAYAGCRQTLHDDGGHTFSHFADYLPAIIADYRHGLDSLAI